MTNPDFYIPCSSVVCVQTPPPFLRGLGCVWDDGSQAIVSVGCIGGRRLLHSRQFLHSKAKKRILQCFDLPVQVVWREMVSRQRLPSLASA